MIGKSCLTIEVVFLIIHMKESILQEHLPLTGEIPPIIIVMTVDYREEGDILMREEDLQRERYPSSDRRPPRRRGLPSNGRPPDRYGGGPPDDEGIP